MINLRPYQQAAFDKIKQRLKEVDHPILVNMSVGSGKSILCSHLLSMIEKANYRALCLTMNSTLISQNHITHQQQGGNSGIYCSGLKELNTNKPVIFGSPQSVAIALKRNNPLSQVRFNLIIIDECQNVDAHNPQSLYMRILNWYGFKAQESKYSFRVIGLSGTPYRGKSVSIVGPDEYFKEEVVKVQMPWLIENGYLAKPYFGITKSDHIDFSNCKIDSTGKFNHSDLEKAITKDERLSGEIMRELISIVEPSNGGAFIFCSTIRHVEECMKSLPRNAAAITASTPHHERKRILDAANQGEIKYLVNVATLLVGVDCPRFHISAFLRPTESLTLYNQAIGRALRLFPGKEKALILDYADNISRFQDFDDPIVNEAVKVINEEHDQCIECYTCGQLNTIFSRRCVGTVDGKRCDYYFSFKDCHVCLKPNDLTSRYCYHCDAELIDPNEKLKKLDFIIEALVTTMKCTVTEKAFYVYYITDKGVFGETYHLGSTKAVNIFYGNWVRKHVDKSSRYYMHLSKPACLDTIAKEAKTPKLLKLSGDKIKGKVF